MQYELAEIEKICIDERFELTDTGFDTAEIDRLHLDLADGADPADIYDPTWEQLPIVSRLRASGSLRRREG